MRAPSEFISILCCASSSTRYPTNPIHNASPYKIVSQKVQGSSHWQSSASLLRANQSQRPVARAAAVCHEVCHGLDLLMRRFWIAFSPLLSSHRSDWDPWPWLRSLPLLPKLSSLAWRLWSGCPTMTGSLPP